MKVKELIEELQKFNPDGTVTVEVIRAKSYPSTTGKVESVEDEACAMINAVIVCHET